MKKWTEAKALTESALLDLFATLNSASSPEEFLGKADAILSDPENLLPLPVSLGIPDVLSCNSTRGAIDVDNAPRVHEYIGEKDRANAADARLWTYLAFATYRQYMEMRWPLLPENNWKGRVRSRWLLHTGSVTRGSLIRHGIARLWWGTHLTFAPAESEGIAKHDAYAYTKELFKNEDRLNAIFDREVGAFPVVIKAVLDHAASLGNKATDNHIRKIMQYLTLTDGFSGVGILKYPAVSALVKTAASR
ncbi:DUF6339 family protein [Spongorhabdus nitratireducens]